MRLHKLFEFPGNGSAFREKPSYSEKTKLPLNSVLFEDNLCLSCSEAYENESHFKKIWLLHDLIIKLVIHSL